MTIADIARTALVNNDSELARIAVSIPGLVSEPMSVRIPRGTTVPSHRTDEILKIFRDTIGCRFFDEKHQGVKRSIATARKHWKEGTTRIKIGFRRSVCGAYTSAMCSWGTGSFHTL